MKSNAILSVGVILIAVFVVSNRGVSVQSLSGPPIATHVGVVVPDIEAALRGYADILGIEVPEVQEVPVPLADGSQVPIKRAVLKVPGFHIEPIEPLSTSGPFYEHLQAYGMSVHHLGLLVDGDVDEMRDRLVGRGGIHTAGATGVFAYVDFREQLGTTLEIQPSTADINDPATPGPQNGLFGGRPVSHIGFAVRDVDVAIQAFVDILGLAPTEAITFPPQGLFPFPPGLGWDATSHVRVTQMRLGNTGLELIEPVGGPNPWTDTLEKQGGNALQHLAMGRGELSRDEWLRVGQEKGGKWTNGGPNGELGGFAYLDFTETLGLIFE
jgi:catechol 2,3-dioxygenase-like lactoylglutathione lyase family enzyme